MTSAKIIADSISPQGHRITTFEVTFHRFVLAEFNTHCVLSRNSASSRAIPVAKQIERVLRDPAIPLSWPAEQKGMQGGEELTPNQVLTARTKWLDARDNAVETARHLVNLGVHKSVTNRLLEPWMWHTAVVTATAWWNFFAQRTGPLAQPELRAAAILMQRQYEESIPRGLFDGAWHLPYLDPTEALTMEPRHRWQVSAARCARVSYLTQDGKRDPGEDIELFHRLTTASPMHASPLEHVATPDATNVHHTLVTDTKQMLTLPRYGKLLGWQALRHLVEADDEYQSFS